MTKEKRFTTPAERFLSQAQTEALARQSEEDMNKRQISFVPPKKENRTRRVQAYFTPSLHKEASDLADKLGLSLNDLLNKVLEEYIKQQ